MELINYAATLNNTPGAYTQAFVPGDLVIIARLDSSSAMNYTTFLGNASALFPALSAAGLFDTITEKTPGAGTTFTTKLIESSGTVTAGTTQTQAGATLLTAQTNNVIVLNTGDGVKLPAAVAGLEIAICNSNTSKALQVYGTGADTINGQTNTVGVSQPPNSIDIFVCPVAGVWVAEVGAGFSAGMLTESSKDSIVALGGGQAGATPITTQTLRITSVTNAGAATPDGIVLPTSAPGLELLVINHAVNGGVGQPITVYGLGTDNVDDVTSAAGVVQMSNSLCIYSCATSGKWYSNGIGSGYSGSFPTVSYTDGITATGATQGTAVLLKTVLNRVTTVAASTGVILPPCAPGIQIVVTNAGASTLSVYPNTGDNINGAAVNIALSIPTGKTASLSTVNPTPGNWHAVISA